MAADDCWVDDSQFDADAAYYENDEYDAVVDGEYDVEAYDEAYTAYLDAHRRFQDLKLSCGFYPVVALADQGSMPTPASSQLPAGAERGKGSGGGGKAKGRGRGKGKNCVRYPPRGERKPPDPRGCALPSLWSHRSPSSSVPTDSQAFSPTFFELSKSKETSHWGNGDPTASWRAGTCHLWRCWWQAPCWLHNAGPWRLCIPHGFWAFPSICRAPQMPGPSHWDHRDAAHPQDFSFWGWSLNNQHWIAKIPIFVNSAMGFAHAFIIKGETPMLMGRPIIEKLGLIVNSKRRTMMFEGHPWRPITMGKMGEYLLSLTEDFDTELIYEPGWEADFNRKAWGLGLCDLPEVWRCLFWNGLNWTSSTTRWSQFAFKTLEELWCCPLHRGEHAQQQCHQGAQVFWSQASTDLGSLCWRIPHVTNCGDSRMPSWSFWLWIRLGFW